MQKREEKREINKNNFKKELHLFVEDFIFVARLN